MAARSYRDTGMTPLNPFVTGGSMDTNSTGKWHPTVVYLLILVVVEFAALGALRHFSGKFGN